VGAGGGRGGGAVGGPVEDVGLPPGTGGGGTRPGGGGGLGGAKGAAALGGGGGLAAGGLGAAGEEEGDGDPRPGCDDPRGGEFERRVITTARPTDLYQLSHQTFSTWACPRQTDLPAGEQEHQHQLKEEQEHGLLRAV
jgi:hypothetical protein